MRRTAVLAITVVVYVCTAWTKSLTEAKEHSARGTEFYRQANFVAAEREYRLALAYAHAFGQTGLAEYTAALTNIAATLQAQGRLKEARQALEECISLHENASPQLRSSTLAHALNNLAIVAQTEGNLSQAVALLRRSSALTTDDRTLGGTLHNLGAMYLEMGQWSTSEKLLGRAVDLYRKAGAKEELSSALTFIAKISARQGDTARAESLLQEALELRIQAFGAIHPNVALTLCDIGEFHTRMKRYDAAIESFERGLRLIEPTLGKDHIFNVSVLYHYAEAKRYQGRHEDALAAYERTIRILELNYGPQHSRLASVYQGAAASSAKLKRKAEAKAYEQRAQALRGTVVDPVRHTVDISAFLATK